jgi:two-component system, OmpR family, aerobic respiration control sensor histidine kinase ArcB
MQVNHIIELVFSSALFMNALLFIPQAARIFREKTAKSVSLFTFFGFLLIQLATVFHGIIHHDPILVIGYLASMLTCGSVVALILLYNKRDFAKAANEMSLEAILEQLPGHIYWKDMNGTNLGCNKNNWEDFGLNALSEFKGKTDYDLFSKSEAKQIRNVDQDVIRMGQLQIIEELVTTGEKTSIYLSHKVPLKNRLGETIGVLGNSIDITRSKREVLDQLEMLENIIAVMPGNVYWMNTEGVYLGCNENQAKAVGFLSRSEIVGKRNEEIRGFFIPEFLDKVNKSVIQTGKAMVVEEPAVLQDGIEATFLSSKVPLCNKEGEITGMVGISIDITERKQSEKALKAAKKMAEVANEAKTEFLCNMQHDLRTPFSGILGLSEFMESKEIDPEKKESLSLITQSAQALLDQLNEIFEFVKVESGQLPILDKEFDLHRVLSDVFNMMGPSAKNKQLTFTLTIADTLPRFVIGDRVRTQRILMNLVANAIKFTQKGSVKIEVRAAREEKTQLVVSFVIEDTGIGVPEDKQNVIFERFNRLTSAYNSPYAGKGLGLRIVKQFLDDMDGRSYLDSEEGKGTTFKILIPYKLPLLDPLEYNKAADTQVAQQSVHLKEGTVAKKQPLKIEINTSKEVTSKSSVLLVEDHPIAARIAGNILSELGCQVDITEDGKTALKWIEQKPYDLIFMDIGLPGMSGYEAAQCIRSNSIRSIAQTPIVALTAHADSDNKQSCLGASMNAVVTKPLTRKQAGNLLDTFIPQRKKGVEESKEQEAKIVDFEYAKKLLGGNETVIFEALHMLVDSFPVELKTIETAYQQEDWKSLQSIAHKLQGGSSYCGTLRLKAVCAELESYIDSGLTARIPELYQRLLAEIEALEKFMERYDQNPPLMDRL